MKLRLSFAFFVRVIACTPLLFVLGCDAATQVDLQIFLGDFAREALAAFLF